MNNAPIGIFDSGIGGLTIAKAITAVLPRENIIYFGDTEHLPYGEKSPEAIQFFSKKIINFLHFKKCKIIIIACNSAASANKKMTSITMTNQDTIFNVIDPVINEVSEKYSNCKIGVIGTKATIGSKIYEKKINSLSNNITVCSLATPLLAPMIEEGFVSGDISEKIIENYLSNIKLKSIQHLILACTHYPLIEKEIKRYYNKNINIIDSANIVAQHISKELKKRNWLKENTSNEHHFFVSNYTKSFEKSTKFFLKKAIKLKEIQLFS